MLINTNREYLTFFQNCLTLIRKIFVKVSSFITENNRFYDTETAKLL